MCYNFIYDPLLDYAALTRDSYGTPTVIIASEKGARIVPDFVDFLETSLINLDLSYVV